MLSAISRRAVVLERRTRRREVSEAQYYDNPALWKPERYTTRDQVARFAEVAGMIPTDAESVLDVGCGNGAFVRYVRDARRISCLGLERSRAAIEIAKQAFDLEITEGDIAEIPFEDNSVDLVAALQVLEHLPYRVYGQALREMERVSRKYLLVDVPFREKRRFNKCALCGCTYPACYHVRTFNENVMPSLFGSSTLVAEKRIFGQFPHLLVYCLWRIMPIHDTNVQCPLCGYRVSTNKSSEEERGPSLLPQSLGKLIKWLPRAGAGFEGSFLLGPRIRIAEETICLYEKKAQHVSRLGFALQAS